MLLAVHPSLAATTVEAPLAERPGLTIVAKLTLELAPEQRARVAPPAPLVPVDRTWGDHPLRSIEAPSDLTLAPRVPELVVRGHAVPPEGTSPTSMTVRVALFRGSVAAVDKCALIEGNRESPGAAPQPIVRVPLTWERAIGGLERPDNPLGSDRPNVLDPNDRSRPIGFGPIAPTSRARRGEPSTTESLQCAPPDQRVPSGFAPGDWLVLLGLSPRGLVRTELPAVRPVARVTTPSGARAFPLVADLMVVDTDRGVLTLTHRARLDLDPHDRGEVVRVEVSLEQDGRASFEGLLPTSSNAPSNASTNASSGGASLALAAGEGTLAAGEGTLAVSSVEPHHEAPFRLSAPGAAQLDPRERSKAIAPPWLFASRAPEAVGEGTISLATSAEGPATRGEALGSHEALAPTAAPRPEPSEPPKPASLATPEPAIVTPPGRPRPTAEGWASASDLLAALALPER